MELPQKNTKIDEKELGNLFLKSPHPFPHPSKERSVIKFRLKTI